MEEYLGRRSPQGAMLPSTPGAWLRVTSQSKPPLPTHFLQEELLRVGKGSKGPCGHPRLPITAMPTAGTAARCLHTSPGCISRVGGSIPPPPLHFNQPSLLPSRRFSPSFLSPHPALPSPPTLRGAQGLPQPRFPRCPHRSGTHRGAPPPDVGLGGGGGRGAERGNTGATRGKVWSSPGAVLAGGHRVDSSEPYRGGVRFPSMLQSGAAAPLLPRPHRSEWSGLGLPRLPPLRPAPPAPLPPRPLPFSAAPQPAAAPHPPPAPLPLSLGAVRGSAGCPLPPRTPSPATAPASPVPCHRLQHLQHEHGPVRPSSSFVCSEQGTARCR